MLHPTEALLATAPPPTAATKPSTGAAHTQHNKSRPAVAVLPAAASGLLFDRRLIITSRRRGARLNNEPRSHLARDTVIGYAHVLYTKSPLGRVWGGTQRCRIRI